VFRRLVRIDAQNTVKGIAFYCPNEAQPTSFITPLPLGFHGINLFLRVSQVLKKAELKSELPLLKDATKAWQLLMPELLAHYQNLKLDDTNCGVDQLTI
jgi:hypothetical protein